MKDNNSFQLWKAILAILLIPLGIALAIIAIHAVFNLLLSTYGCGYMGLVVRMIVMTALPALLAVFVVGWHIRSKKKNSKDHLLRNVFLVLIVTVVLMSYFDIKGTWKDLHSEPISAEYKFVIDQTHSEARIIINSEKPVHSFKMSLFERLYDENGEVIFLPFHDGSRWGISLYRRVWHSDYYKGTFEYYPNTNTRIAITNIERLN